MSKGDDPDHGNDITEAKRVKKVPEPSAQILWRPLYTGDLAASVSQIPDQKVRPMNEHAQATQEVLKGMDSFMESSLTR